MYVSLDWINELVSLKNITINNLVSKLTLGGFEVEEILKLYIHNQKKIILNISTTANRSDTISIQGIGKEFSVLLNKPIKISNYVKVNSRLIKNFYNNFTVYDNSEYYSTFLTIIIENFNTIKSPIWLQEKLICSGIKPINNLLDYKNYIFLETGYPFEFYDLKKLSKKLIKSDFNLTLKLNNKDLYFEAENNQTYNLKSKILTINVNDQILSIGGIIGNKNFCYDNQTTSLLLEGVIFNSKKIRQQSRIIGLKTTRSLHYEKGLNSSLFFESLIKLLKLLKITNSKIKYNIHTISKLSNNKLLKIILNYKTIIEILGPFSISNNYQKIFLSPVHISEYLIRLNFKFIFATNKLQWNTEIPNSRILDIEREIDLIEEIGRLHGFNNFLINLPSIKKFGCEDLSYKIRKKITTCFLSEGFNELIHYSLIHDKTANSIKLINPLITEYCYLRNSLLPNLLKTLKNNIKQGNFNLEGFEYGHSFLTNNTLKFFETEKIAGVFGGIKFKQSWNEKSTFLSWFEGKNKIDEIFKKLKILVYWKNEIPYNYKSIFHPYKTSTIVSSTGEYLGIFGQIHPNIAKKQNLSAKLFLFELEFDLFKYKFQNISLTLYQHYSPYPKIVKDLSFVINQKFSFTQIQKTILEYGTESLKNIKVLDEYRGINIPINETSLCIQLTFQSTKKTLLNQEIEKLINKLQNILIKQYDVNIRI